MPYWNNVLLNGKPLSLEHLEPFEFQMLPDGWELPATVSVTFHDHCFTETFDSQRHDGILVTNQSANTEKRAFDKERYELSFRLPMIIQALGAKRIASTREGNMVRIEIADGRHYAVFFTLRRHNKRRANLHVVSAYVPDNHKSVAATGETRFNLALCKVLRGESPKFPKRQ